MKASKDQIINGVVSYAENELIPKIKDQAMKIIFATSVLLLKMNHSIADPIFEHKFVKTIFVPDDDGLYELDDISNALESSLRTYGNFPLMLPTVPIVSPEEKKFELGPSDVVEIKRRIIDSKS